MIRFPSGSESPRLVAVWETRADVSYPSPVKNAAILSASRKDKMSCDDNSTSKVCADTVCGTLRQAIETEIVIYHRAGRSAFRDVQGHQIRKAEFINGFNWQESNEKAA